MTPNAEEATKRLMEIASEWGGSIKIIPESLFKDLESTRYPRRLGWSFAFTHGHGLHWKSKRIIACGGHVDPGALIHEMGHAFLDLSGPWDSDELSWLGWEICLAKKAGCYRIWSRQNWDYYVEATPAISSRIQWGELTSREKSLLADDRIRCGKKIGIIDDLGNPLALR